MGQHIHYSKTKERWFYYCRIVKNGKTIASNKVYAKKKGPELDWPKRPNKEQKEYLRVNSYLPSDKDVRETMVRLNNEVASRGSTYETNDKISLFQLFDMYMDKKDFKKTSAKKSVEQALNRIKHILAYNPKVKDLNIKHYKTIIDFREKYKWNQKIICPIFQRILGTK